MANKLERYRAKPAQYETVKRLAAEHNGTEDMDEHGAIDVVNSTPG